MVKVILSFALISLVFSASAERTRFTPEMLEDIASGRANTHSDNMKRFKARSLSNRYENKKKLRYKLPSGRYVAGYLLPNGKVSPAIKNNGQLYPACILQTGKLIKGVYVAGTKTVHCDLPVQELYFIPELYTAQGSDDSNINPEPAPAVRKVSSKYAAAKAPASKNTVQAKSSSEKATNATAKKSSPTNPYIYLPPVVSTESASMISKVVSSGRKKYGIKKGVWADIELTRSVTSSDRDEVEFVLNAGIEGRFASIPPGSTVFGRKSFNYQSKRLEVFVTSGITPDDEEFSLNAWVFSPDKSAGLHGVIVRDREGEVDAAAGKALLTGIGSAVAPIGSGGQIAGNAAKSFSQDMLNNEGRHLPETPKAIIKVAPQVALLKIAKSF